MLRVAGGTARGRKLKSPRGLSFRPTTGRVKEYIFSVIGPDIMRFEALDLFSGSGSLGIEALSRGAVHVKFVEQSASNIRLIAHNLEICGFLERATIMRGDVFKTLGFFGRKKERFNLVLADPPFKMSFRSRIVETVADHGVLASGGQLIVEHQDNDPGGQIQALECVRQKKFGHCMVSIYQPLE